jgi:type IV pilus assembly protein PilY1
MTFRALIAASVLAIAVALAPVAQAQTTVSEDFTGAATNNPWFFFLGACLTAGNGTTTASPGATVPGCGSVFTNYYSPAGDSYLVGGAYGYLGTSTPGLTADPVGNGALRFTNGSLPNSTGTGYNYGFNERGAIVSASAPFPTGSGVQITFKTITYLGNKGGTGDGADGISFYLLDGCMPIAGATSSIPGSVVPSNCNPNAIYGTGQTFPAIGAFGGSLAYSCANINNPHDGLVGAYLGLGIDEYGNFLNGWVNTLNESGSSGTSGGSTSFNDNTASGGLYQPGRIGLRGAGSVSWQALNTAYGTSTGSSNPYYPATLSTTYCSTGTNSGSRCASCTSGPFIPATGQCTGNYSCATGTTLVGTNCESCAAGTLNAGQCNNICANGVYETNGQFPNTCNICSNGSSNLTYHTRSNTYTCNSRGTLTSVAATSVAATTTAAPLINTTPTYSSSVDQRQQAVQNTCQTGNLYNYSNPAAPVSVGPAVFGASYNPAGILDYAAIGSTVNSSAQGYSVLTNQIASETSTTRGAITNNPIAYSLKITQDGLLSLSYSYNGGSAVPVITNQSITANNGPLPQSFRFGFAGSSGGSTNVHEILCFKAAPVQTSSGSGGVNVFQDPTLKTGAQLFLGSYFPADWTGSVTATPIFFNSATNSLALATAPAWDGGCVLTGGACATTGAATGTAEAPASRVMLTWNGTAGIPFEWPGSTGAGISAAQQTALDFGDATQTANRLNYLRGDRTNEVNSNGVGLYRARDRVLGDIIDSSPSWVGPPGEPYVSLTSWVDQIYPTLSPPENAGQTYLTYQQSKQGRTNVVYVGSNDGFLHGFRAGTLDASGNLVVTTTNPNDGYEVLAYMPGAVVNSIHPTITTNGVTTVNTALDYSNTQYAHAYFVDATPTTGDLFYNGTWHTWVVGGLGSGGAAIYALDVTDPTQFSEANAATLVIGEWTPANLTCANDTTLPLPCKNYLGNTFGTPEIRRFHSGQWGVIFGNGYNDIDSNKHAGAAGIFIMLIDSTSGAPTFYYLPATAASATALPNGIASPTSLDIDLDHVVDYVYAGDLLGNVWKFDVTSQSPGSWGKTTSSPIFTAPYTPAVAAVGTTPAIPAEPSPITTRLQVGTLKAFGSSSTGTGVVISNSPERVIINFGTGQQIPQTLTSAAQYANGPQYLYGIWDWDFGYAPTGSTSAPAGSWNKLSPNQQAVALAGPQTIVAPGTGTNLQVQTITASSVGTGAAAVAVRSMSHTAVCWKGDTACGGGTSQTQFGWFIQLPGANEQVIFDPTYSPDGEFVVSTYIPAVNTVLSCKVVTATGFSMGLDPLSGGGSPTPFFNVGGTSFDGVQLNGTGTPSFLSSGQASDNNAEFMLTQTSSGTPAAPQQVNRQAIVTGQRLNWIQRR